jgi:hypothetical protein
VKRLSVTAVGVLAMAAASLIGWVAPADPISAYVQQRRGASADAGFVTMLDECMTAKTYVSAANWTGKNGLGAKVEGAAIFVEIGAYDSCLNVWRMSVWGHTDTATVEVDPHGASAAGTVTVCDGGGTCWEVYVSVDWEISGGAPSVSGWHDHVGGCIYRDHNLSRGAAASGAVVDISSGLNLTPDPAAWASVDYGNSQWVCNF